MIDARFAFFPWLRDIALAYAGGLIVGAPVALVAVWITGNDRLVTVCLLIAMTAILVALRRSVAEAHASDDAAAPAGRDVGASVREPRRVA
jgi:hypothetical protein